MAEEQAALLGLRLQEQPDAAAQAALGVCTPPLPA
jgi:hypothetical protein